MTTTGTLLLIEDNEDDIDLTLLAFEQANLKPQIVVARQPGIYWMVINRPPPS